MEFLTSAVEEPETKVRLIRRGCWVLAVLVSYVMALAIATYPYCKTLTSGIPEVADPILHLWILRWNKQCLLEGRSPAVCPDVLIPVGLPLALDPPLPLQTLLYLTASLATDNDAVSYNVIWLFGYLSTGLATALLAWYMVRDLACAWLAGLLAMLCTPMMLHGHGHLDSMQIGAVPIFLLCWMRFIDWPTRARALAAGASYLLASASAPYLALLTPFPAAAYVLWRAWTQGKAGYWPWLKARVRWLFRFVALALPGLFLIFSNQVMGVLNGVSMTRPAPNFDLYDVPVWSYFVPTPLHRLSNLLPYDLYEHSGHSACLVECGSYLGVVTLFLMFCAAVGRFRCSRAGFWWFATLMLVVLSLGASLSIGGHTIGLPSGWLRDWFPPFQFIRVASRFNLITSICAAVLAAAGLCQLFRLIPYRSARMALCIALACLAVADLGMTPFPAFKIPTLPPIYQDLKREGARANLLEIPQFTSAGSDLGALAGYWQAQHGQRTSATYSGFRNVTYDNLIVDPSPFNVFDLINPDFLANPNSMNFDLYRNISFDDYVWLYTKAHGFDYIVLHQTPQTSQGLDLHLERLKEHLAPAAVGDDGRRVSYDVSKLKPPSRPVLLCAQGFGERFANDGKLSCMVAETSTIVLYNPWPDRPLQLAFEAEAVVEPRKVRLRADGKIIATWTVDPTAQPPAQQLMTPPMLFPRGVQKLLLESDDEITPPEFLSKHILSKPEPFSILVSAVVLIDAETLAAQQKAEVAR